MCMQKSTHLYTPEGRQIDRGQQHHTTTTELQFWFSPDSLERLRIQLQETSLQNTWEWVYLCKEHMLGFTAQYKFSHIQIVLTHAVL